MNHAAGRDPGTPAPAPVFATTHWSVVLTAANAHSPQASDALEQLCRAYWYPLYAFVRRQGYAAHDAQDLTQGFFASFLKKDYLATVGPEKGRFRSFLLAALRHFLSDERDRAGAAKRGGGQRLIRLDEREAEERYRLEPADTRSPDKLFERHWALTVMERALVRLQKEYVAAGKAELYEQLKAFHAGNCPETTYGDAAERLGLPENTLKSHVRRLRHRYRELVRDEIAQTLADPAEVETELRYLIAVVDG